MSNLATQHLLADMGITGSITLVTIRMVGSTTSAWIGTARAVRSQAQRPPINVFRPGWIVRSVLVTN
eukprot:6220159-Heterocapsa_arctica.AAC.1